MKLLIHNLSLVNQFLSSVVNIAPDGKFILTPTECNIKVLSEGGTLRAFFTTDALTSESPVEFSFKDINKLYRTLTLIPDDLTNIELEFDGTFLKFNNCNKFKLTTVKTEIIAKYVTDDLKTELIPVYSFDTTPQLIDSVIRYANVINETDTKIYFSCTENNNIMAEIDNKSNSLSSSIGYIVSCDKSLKGDINKVISVNIMNFKLFGVLPADKIKITYTDKNVIQIDSILKNKDNYIKLLLISSTLKG